MKDKKDNIRLKDPNADPMIFRILNDAYHEFKEKWGEKHSAYIKQQIELLTDKIEKADLYYTGSIATANPESGVRYTKSDDLPAILKHELWHVYNNVAIDKEKSFNYLPERYINHLEKTGFLQSEYTTEMEKVKERFKDSPVVLEDTLINYEEYKKEFNFGDGPIEMWTEWFSTQTHTKDMKDHFWDWGSGFYTKSYSSGSYYDSLINIASLLSDIVPKEKLLEGYLQTGQHQTDYSYSQMLDDFDQQYANALQGKEKEKYGYPFLKILMKIKTIYDTAQENPSIALNALQSCMITCMDAYLIKLENRQGIDVKQAKDIYGQIKHMQEHMIWNVDISKMKDLDCAQSMMRIQDQFKSMLQSLDKQNSEVAEMLNTVDYTDKNPYAKIPEGDQIAQKMLNANAEEKRGLYSIGQYKVQVGSNGIQDNLYQSLFTVLGKEKYNLLFTQFQKDKSFSQEHNLLYDIHSRIKNATSDQDFVAIYDTIYETYAKKIERNLKTDQNIEHLFQRYAKDIVKLQSLAPYDEATKKYLPTLEHVMKVYYAKQDEYGQNIDKVTKERIIKDQQRGNPIKVISELANDSKNLLKERKEEIEEQREKQLREDKELEETTNQNKGKTSYSIRVNQIGKATIHVPTEEKKKAEQIEQKTIERNQQNLDMEREK